MRCSIIGNSGRCGGGIRCQEAQPTFRDCLIARNIAGLYGAMDLTMSEATFTNCTIVDNTSTGGGGAIVIYILGTNTFTNCVIWQNSVPQIDLDGGQAAVTYTDIQGGWSGSGNMNRDPGFVDAPANNYRLAAESQCIESGDPAFVPMPGETDLDGLLRVWSGRGYHDARVDMGAYEFGSFRPGDVNCDGAFDGADIQIFFLALSDPAAYRAEFPDCNLLLGDMNGDGSVDGGDIQRFFDQLMQ